MTATGTVAPARAGATLQAQLRERLDELEQQRASEVEARLLGARQVEAEAEAAELALETMRARLVVADMLQRVGEGARGAQLAIEVNAWALAQGPASLQSRSHLVLSSVFESIGDTASSLDHAVRALELQDPAVRSVDRGLCLLRLADASALIGEIGEARRRYAEAEAVFAALGDGDRVLNVVNNLAVLEYENGNTEAALAAAHRLGQACGPDGLHPSYADTIARAHLAAGELAAAQQAVTQGLQLWRARGDAQAVTPAELALTQVEVLLAGRDLDGAAAHLDECMRICEERNLRGIRVQALELRATLLAARADFQGAYLAHRAFHEEFVAVRSHQQEAAARTRQAVAETAEARAEAQRFWEQARTDPLTELFNRRFVDEELPGLLSTAIEDGACLVAAIVDVDHFKRINDTFSHAVGDHVLSWLGARLAAAAPGGPGRSGLGGATSSAGRQHRGFAARLGGEEFLLVQTAGSVAQALAHLERLRADVQSQTWDAVDPRLAVTISIGVAVAASADTQTTLLTRADELLYRAKQEGRNRVVAELAPLER